jgi:signal transduction histidine kinase
MSDLAGRTDGSCGGRRTTQREAPGNSIPGAALQNIIAERMDRGLAFVNHACESLDDDRGPPLRASEPLDSAAASRRKDEFLAVLGHELRTPLATIKNALHVLRSQVTENLTRQKAQDLIERQVRRISRLVDELQDVSLINRGRLQLRRERIDLRVVVRNAVETLESDIRERNHHLATALPEGPVWIQGDPQRLEQVFVNLLANASRYTKPGGELAVWMHTRDVQVVVRVRDSGIGIAPQVLPGIFDMFSRADEAVQHSESGLGIGLALVRNLVELHGGSVVGASAGRGKGSEFTVCLPREV